MPYGVPALETALPLLVSVLVWVPELVVDVPDCTKALWLALSPMADSALEPGPPAETASPAWVHEPLVVVPD
jgi:hypothetical protein